MKIAVSFLKIGSEFQGIFAHGIGLISDILKNDNAEITIIIDKHHYKDILLKTFPKIKIHFINSQKKIFLEKISIFIYLFFKINFFKNKFCKQINEIEKENFDIILHPNWSIYSFGIETFSIASVHDTAFENNDYKQDIIHKIKLKFLVRLICKFSNIVLCESEIGKKDIIRIFSVNPNKIIVRLNLPDETFKNISKIHKEQFEDKFEELNNCNFLLLPSRWGQYKNQKRVINALDKYNRERSDKLKLVLTGVGNSINEAYHFLKKNNLSSENIIIYTSVTTEQLIQLYKNAYALIFPSLLGPTSLPLFEALENNCPIITSNLDGHQEVLGNSALFVNPLSEDSIYKSFIELNESKIILLKERMLRQKKYLENEHQTKDWFSNSLKKFNNFR